jgi:hypothetical protein
MKYRRNPRFKDTGGETAGAPKMSCDAGDSPPFWAADTYFSAFAIASQSRESKIFRIVG